MQGWIIYKETEANLKPENYEIQYFIKVANEQNISLKVLRPEQFDIIVTREDRKSIFVDGKPAPLPDFVLPRMGAGTTYFALSIMRHLEKLGVPCVNSSFSVETVKDKLFTQQILAEKNLPVPKTMLMRFPIDAELIEKQIGFPVVIKAISGSQGKGVFLAEKKSHLIDLIQLIEVTNPKFNLILQEFVQSSFGRDLRVFVIGGRVVGCMERTSADTGFKANYSAGGTVREHEVTPEIEWLATEASRILGLDIAGVDLLFDESHYKICEVNSSPGFEGLQSCCNVNIPREIYHYLKIRYGMFF
ncbi:MAG: RimK family alpha-L-glutamate ligase [Eubacteriales bacterium]|nr:RimK family alpha-L-glutamate ligase [Eubacteriales bacterium]